MMPRRIITPSDAARLREHETPGDLQEDSLAGASAREPGAAVVVPSQYMDALTKLIPPEIVAAFLAIDGLIRGSSTSITPTMYWGIYIAEVAITAAYIRWATTVAGLATATRQILLGSIGFVIWTYAIGGPFEFGTTPDFPYNAALGGIVAILFTLAAPLVAKR